MDASTKTLIQLLSCVRKRDAKRTVREKVASGCCLQCDRRAAKGHRGLCEFCHGQFKYARSLYAKCVAITREEERRGVTLAAKIKEKKKEFDDQEVARGNILDSQQGKHGKSNPFIAA